MTLGVCMVTADFYPLVGGMQTHTLALAQHLQAMGVDVFVITRRCQKTPLYEEVGGIAIHRVDIHPDASKVKVAIQFISGALRLMKRQQERFQIIHSHQVISPTTVGLIGRELMSKKLIVNLHSAKRGGGLGILLRRRPLTGRPRLLWMKKRVDAFVAISQEVKRDLIDLGFPPAKIAYIPNGVDTTRFAPLSASDKMARRHELNLPNGPIFIYAGRLTAIKQVGVLLRAFAGMMPRLPSSARLLIVGDGEERKRLKDMTVELGISQRVKFVGCIVNIDAYLQASDVFVLPSRSEGLPVALLEAMACGLLCVASAAGGILDVLRSGVNGLTVPPGDVHALQNALETLCSHPSMPDQLAKQARLDVCRYYPMERTAHDFLQLYYGVLAAAPLQLTRQRLPSG